eukprot:TRINITY_DN3063_c0_g1_i1.p1 TRINITY_DN3063_c0_g1~~TRINITY_DN3063_c0_g1_i1.p1  ORF type:complete len:242 (+),score=43.76 TRINITY_DN3063_c0_g1_i1:40-765(+)
MEEEAIVTYVDTTIFQSDLDVLDPGCWLNDKIIGFYFDFLTTEKIKSNKILFMNPSTMILLAFIEDPQELAEALSDLQLSKRDLVFIPINNNSDVTQAGGSHWSLLVFERHHNTFYYIDSAHEMNRVPASHTATKLVPLLHPELQNAKKSHSNKGLFNFGSPHSGDERTRFHVVNSPQQENGYDCGVYTIASAELIASTDHPFKNLEELLKKNITPKFVTQKRAAIKALILEKALQENKAT